MLVLLPLRGALVDTGEARPLQFWLPGAGRLALMCIAAEQGVTKRCRLSWLTYGALVNEPKIGGRKELRGLSQ